mmetsp:Transcript_49792/g.82625  ORF Transcript_49792/g.82625 Transcript_49792/m.82625 type:complete len:206 (-) Transcript_49792:509-1126(-)
MRSEHRAASSSCSVSRASYSISSSTCDASKKTVTASEACAAGVLGRVPGNVISLKVPVSSRTACSCSCTVGGGGSSMTLTGCVAMFFARFAYLRVLRVSSNWSDELETVAIITVWHAPSSESFSSLVSFESRYGIWVDRPSTSAEIQLPRAERERLIFVASLSRSPEACVLDCRSEPAKSTRLSLPMRMEEEPSGRVSQLSTVME